jgi:hypothetical protein
MRYRKKPVVIEAFQTDKELDIETLEGTMHASVGDYIITGVRGEKYPCKPDIFEQTYEPADAPTASPWHRVEEKPMDGQECIVAHEGPTDWIYEHATYHSDLNKALEEDIFIEGTDGFIVDGDVGYARHRFNYWMPIEPPKEDA